ncbi:ERMES complex subunit [Saccharomycopsis crataegensis]|uniref:Mitochondrial distribution and morphology protein 34 n=1 Tax=Saccharomycopsis crataegensis TaxID=43959 RepID=A0AAV5QI71_9ASCO|nr:ERMES complex subunit [Saccharomycopsis crataegensis]
MSVNINWNSLEQESLLCWSRDLLNDALNSGKKPSILASDIEIQDLHFGNNAPIVEILEIGDLDTDKFRGIFKIKYAGDSYINLATKIQANPMNIFHNNSLAKYSDFILPELGMVNQKFEIPINLKLSKIMLSGIIIIVFNKSKGLTLVFKNDPLENIDVSSTFDAIPAVRKFLQIQIENQIRDLFREILPNVLYKVSQRWTNNIHSQLLNGGSNKVNKENDKKVVLFSDINPDGPDLSPGNLLRLSTLSGSRQSLSLGIPKIKDFIQRSTIEKFINVHNRIKNQNSFFLFNNHKYANGLPIELFAASNGDMTHDYSSIEKAIVDVSKYQSINYNNKNQTNNKHVKKPRRRVIKLGGPKKKAGVSSQPKADDDDASSDITAVSFNKTGLRSDVAHTDNDEGDSATLVDDIEDLDNPECSANSSDSYITGHKLREKRALSSSSASVEYLRSLYAEQQKSQKANEIKKAIDNSMKNNDESNKNFKQEVKRPYIITQISTDNSNKDNIRSPLNDKSMLSLSLGLNNRVINRSEGKKGIISNAVKSKKEGAHATKTPVKHKDKNKPETVTIKLKLNDKIRNEKARDKNSSNNSEYATSKYYKKLSNFNNIPSSDEGLVGNRKTGAIDFFTSNPVLSDIPPPYAP